MEHVFAYRREEDSPSRGEWRTPRPTYLERVILERKGSSCSGSEAEISRMRQRRIRRFLPCMPEDINIESRARSNVDEVIIQPGEWDEKVGKVDVGVKMPKLSKVQARAFRF